MNKLIIIIIILIGIIMYFTYRYDKKNIEGFPEANTNVQNVISFLARNYLKVTNDGGIAIQDVDKNVLPITVNNGLVQLGDKFSFDPSGNETKCGDFNLKKDGKLIGINSKLEVDPSGNVIIDDFIYNKGGILTRKDNSFKVDQSGNLDFGEYKFGQGRLERKDGKLKVDSTGNLDFGDFKFEQGQLERKDGKLKVDPSGVITVDPSGNINIGDIVYRADGSINNPRAGYEIDKNNKVKINNSDILDNELFKLVDNIPYFKVSKIVLQKVGNPSLTLNDYQTQLFPSTTTTAGTQCTHKQLYVWNYTTSCSKEASVPLYNYYNDLSKYPLHIAGIQFKDIQNNLIQPQNNYTLVTTNMVYNHNPSNAISSSSLSAINLFNESDSSNFTGVGTGSNRHAYEFNFTQPQLIKNITITNRKDSNQNCINYSTLLIYGKVNNTETLLKTISLNGFDQNPHYNRGNFFTNGSGLQRLQVNLYP